MLVDSHCHLDRLDLTAYQGDLSKALLAAKSRDVSHILCVSIDLENFKSVLQIAENYPEVTASLGLHPTELVTKEPTVDDLIVLAQNPKVIAIGETGLDYYRCEGDIGWQQERFRTHIKAAIALNKPLIVHTREARDDTIRILKEEGAERVGGVLHCFTETWEMAQKAMDMGFYISFSGIVTFKNAVSLKEIAKKMPWDRILIETDAPYLAPEPHRGKPNEPAYVRYVAEAIAELREDDYAVVAEHTKANFFRLFNF